VSEYVILIGLVALFGILAFSGFGSGAEKMTHDVAVDIARFGF
jgi:hypothetical protein